MAKKKTEPKKPAPVDVHNAIAKKLIKVEAEIELLKRHNIDISERIAEITEAYNSSKKIRL